MAKRELKPWHHKASTALAVATLLCVLGYFAETFSGIFMSDRDPVLIAIERIKSG